MRYLKTYETYSVNEELFGAMGKLIGNLFKKAKERIRKTKGGKEVEAIYQKYISLINAEFIKKANVELNLLQSIGESLIKEADTPTKEADTKMGAKTLKEKSDVLDEIIKKMKDMAGKEMDDILLKMGGASKNPKLAIIINAKKDQFDLDFLNAKINYLEKSGDKEVIDEISKERDLIVKKIESSYKNFDSVKSVDYKAGDDVIYLLKNKTRDDWNKLNDEQKKLTNESPAISIVGTGRIQKIENNIVYINYGDGKITEKSPNDIIYKKDDKSKEAQNAAKELGLIKDDEDKMNKVASFAKFLQDDNNKDRADEIEKMIKGE